MQALHKARAAPMPMGSQAHLLGQVEPLPMTLPQELVRRPPKLGLSREARIVDHLELLDYQDDSPITGFVYPTLIDLGDRELRQLPALHQRGMPLERFGHRPAVV